MKIRVLLTFLLVFSLINFGYSQVQEWQSISSFPGAGRDGAVRFVIGNVAYVGLGTVYNNGNTYKDDFYKYEVENDQWTPIAQFPGNARSSAVAFVANNKAYVGTGYDADNSLADFYEYDPSTDTWKSIASIPNTRKAASSFVIDNTGYVGLGTGSSSQLSDFYKYDATLDQWIPIAGIGTGEERAAAVGFAANGKGYISSGQKIDGGTTIFSDIQSYDPISDSWTEEVFADINLSSLMSNTAFVDEDGLVHILKSSSNNKEVVIDLSDFSVSSNDYYFSDDRDDPVVFYINNEVITGLGATGNVFDPVYQTSFQKLVTIQPPSAPVLKSSTYEYSNSEESIKITWTNTDSDHDGNKIYIKPEWSTQYKFIDEVAPDASEYSIPNSKLSRNSLHDVKVVAHNGLAEANSNRLSFYPIFRESRINTPEIVSITADDSFQNKEIEIINYDLGARVIVERRINNWSFSDIDTLGIAAGLSKSTVFKFSDTYFGNATTVDYRVRLFDESAVRRSSSNSSNTISFDLSKLPPLIDDFRVSKVEASERSFSVRFNALSFINIDDLVLQHRNIGDSAFTNDTIEFGLTLSLYDEIDSVEARLIGSNQFGKDTTELIPFYTTLLVPSGLESFYSSINAVGFNFSNRSNVEEGVVVERATNGGDFEIYDSIPINKYEYYDENVVEGNRYSYRLYNYKESFTSKKSSEVNTSAINMGVWKKFNDDGLASAFDALGAISIEKKLINKDDIYLLSESSKKFYKYSLSDTAFVKLQDLPDDSLRRFNDIVLHNNVIYALGGQKLNNDFNSKIYRYDIAEGTWDKTLEIPYGNLELQFSHVVNDRIYMVLYNPSANGNLEIAYYDTVSKVWSKTTYDERYVLPHYVSHTNDSLLIFAEGQGKISYNFNSKEISIEDRSIDYRSRFYSNSTTTYNGELMHFSSQSIDVLNTDDRPYLTFKEYLPVEQESQGYAFMLNDILFYGLSLGDYTYDRELEKYYYRSDLLYYKDETIPLTAAHLKVDSVGIEKAKFSWIDSPNEESYFIEIINNDSIYFADTLDQNTSKISIDNLQPDSYYSVELVSLKGENSRNSIFSYFRTKRGRPYRPTGFTSKAISSSEILYTWDPIDTTEIPVDSLVLRDWRNYEFPVDKVLDLSDTTFLQTGLEENQQASFDLLVKNQYGARSAWIENRAYTYLNSPSIEHVELHETAAYYDVVFQDRSSLENYYFVYRKSSSDTAFMKLDSISTERDFLADENLHYFDKNADLDNQYEYYVISKYRGVNEYSDTTTYYTLTSLPSETISTEDAVLSVNPYLDAEISIYPNPANDFLRYTLGDDIGLREISIINVNGEIVRTVRSKEGINLSDLSSGLYFVRFRTDQGETTKKLIKR